MNCFVSKVIALRMAMRFNLFMNDSESLVQLALFTKRV